MTISRLLFAVVAAAGMASAQNTISAVVEGVGTCAVQNWAFGASQPPAATGGTGSGAGRVQISALAFTRQLDQCSPVLFGRVLTGTHIAKLVLSQYDSTGRTEIMTITLYDVLVSNYQLAGNTASPAPGESVAFSFGRIQFAYRSPNGGMVEAGWDVMVNKPF